MYISIDSGEYGSNSLYVLRVRHYGINRLPVNGVLEERRQIHMQSIHDRRHHPRMHGMRGERRDHGTFLAAVFIHVGPILTIPAEDRHFQGTRTNAVCKYLYWTAGFLVHILHGFMHVMMRDLVHGPLIFGQPFSRYTV